MPQLSLYLNDATMGTLRTDATKEKMSSFRYAADLISSKHESSTRPKECWEGIYGALAEDSFTVPDEPPGGSRRQAARLLASRRPHVLS